MARPIRRIVTGHNAEGRSVFLMDGSAENVRDRPGGGGVIISKLYSIPSVA